MGFINDGFKNRHFAVGAGTLVGIILLFVFGKYIIMCILFVVVLVLAMACIGFLGKFIDTIADMIFDPKGGNKDE